MVSTKTVVVGLVVIFVLFFIIQDPTAAANIVRNVGHWAGHVGDQLSRFVSGLTGS